MDYSAGLNSGLGLTAAQWREVAAGWQERAEKAEADSQLLVASLREAVSALYGCRYSEQPLAKKLDDVLKQITGKSQADLTLEWAYAQANKSTASSLPAE